jgi:hypothetical protein
MGENQKINYYEIDGQKFTEQQLGEILIKAELYDLQMQIRSGKRENHQKFAKRNLEIFKQMLINIRNFQRMNQAINEVKAANPYVNVEEMKTQLVLHHNRLLGGMIN